MNTRILFILSLGLSVLGLPARAVTVATPAAGYFRLEAGGGRDNWLSLPLVKRSELIRRIATVGPATLSLGGSSLNSNAYAPTSFGAYYLQFVSGNLAGICYKITGNTTSGVTVETKGDDLTAHVLGTVAAGATGDLIRIRPYWTVADIFGHDASLLLDPVSALAPAIYTQSDALLFPDNQSVSTEKSAAAVVAYVAGQGWRQQGQPATDSSNAVFSPGVPFVLRRQAAAAISTLVVGYVSQEPGLIRLPSLPTGGETDLAVALFEPIPARMGDSGLASAIESSIDAASARDLLLNPSDIRNGFSIPPARRFHVVGTSWYEGETLADDQILRYGSGFFIRLRGERPVRYWRQAGVN